MTTYTTEAICLKTFDYREGDRIVGFFSPEYGRIQAVVKGARKEKSKLAGACEPMNISELQLLKGRNMDTLCQYQATESFRNIRGDILRLAFGMLCLELVNIMAMGEDQDSEGIYLLLKSALQGLNQPEATSSDILSTAISFQMQLLRVAGYDPVLDRCVISGEPVLFDRPYYAFSPEMGGIVLVNSPELFQKRMGDHRQTVNVSTSTLKVLMQPLGADWASADSLKVQKFLQYFCSYKLEKRLKAYDFVFQVLEQDLETAKIMGKTPEQAL